jgi:formylglycine-generating enzyme required for sulfatase activity
MGAIAAGLLPAGLIGDLPPPKPAMPAVATVTLMPRPHLYRIAGDFWRDGMPVDAPLVSMSVAQPLEIMQRQVTATEYNMCVEDGGCRPRDGRAGTGDVPAVGVSWQDATAYARWLSARTGDTWRLPTDAEWAFATGTRFADDAVGGARGSDRWLARYEFEAQRDGAEDRAPQPVGTFGENENGLFDVSGNVWEWTDTCFVRQAIDASDQPVGDAVENCGVRVVEGRHRTYITDFIRDARAGGCSVGVPPANLGFRLVREPRSDPLVSLLSWLGFL